MNNNPRDTREDELTTIADMSEVDRKTPLGFVRAKKTAPSTIPESAPTVQLNREERGMVIRGAILAGLTLTVVFGIAAAAVIFLLSLAPV